MEMREQPPECSGSVYLVPGRGPEKCKGPGVGAWHVPETSWKASEAGQSVGLEGERVEEAQEGGL